MGGFLIIKLVKPTKIFCSWTPHQCGVGQLLFSQTKPNVWTAAARILRKADATERQKIRRFNPADRSFDKVTELLPLFVGNGGAKILNFDQALADEYDLGDVGNSCYPRVANQLRIEGQ